MQQFKGRRQLFLTMEFSHLAVAAILCTIGYVYCDVITLPTCTEHAGYLHMFKIEAKDSVMIGAKGSSEKTCTKVNLEHLDDIEEVSIPVYNCLGGMAAAAHTFEKYSSVTNIDIGNRGAFFSFFPRDEPPAENPFLAMRYVVALWTKNEWNGVCKRDEPGLVYMLTLGNTNDGTGVVYQIKGASGDEPEHQIDHLLSLEADPTKATLLHKFGVKDCERAINAILHEINDDTFDEITIMTEFSNIAFYVKEARKDDFMRMVHNGVHQFLQDAQQGTPMPP